MGQRSLRATSARDCVQRVAPSSVTSVFLSLLVLAGYVDVFIQRVDVSSEPTPVAPHKLENRRLAVTPPRTRERGRDVPL